MKTTSASYGLLSVAFTFPVLPVIEPPSSNWWNQMQTKTAKHWAELPKSSQREGGEIKWANGSSPPLNFDVRVFNELDAHQFLPGWLNNEFRGSIVSAFTNTFRPQFIIGTLCSSLLFNFTGFWGYELQYSHLHSTYFNPWWS